MADTPETDLACIEPDSLAERDAADPLARFRAEFELPEGVVYVDGNSLGAQPRRAEQIALKVLRRDWRDGLSAVGTMPAGTTCRGVWATRSRVWSAPHPAKW